MGLDTVSQPYLLLLLLFRLLMLDFKPLTVFTVQRLADSSATGLRDAVGVTEGGTNELDR